MSVVVSRPVRVGVVGCGLIAQVMHLPHLVELSDRFSLVAVCDLSEELARACAGRYGAAAAYTRWEDLIAADLDAVLVLTSGNHGPIGTAAARAGKHVFAEKPLALSSAGAAEMIAAAEEADTVLMVGMMKRFDPAYGRLVEVLGDTSDVRLVRVTTLESPIAPYVAHLPLLRGAPPPAALLADLQAEEDRVLADALGDVAPTTRACHRTVLLECLIHELNLLRGILGDPSEVCAAALGPACVNIHLRFGDVQCHLSWVDLPGIARYRQEFAFYAPDRRVTLVLGSPFLRNTPGRVFVEGGDPATPHSWEREEVVSYDEAFLKELVEFADCIETGRMPVSRGGDGLADISLCEAVAGADRGVPLSTPVRT